MLQTFLFIEWNDERTQKEKTVEKYISVRAFCHNTHSALIRTIIVCMCLRMP